jgi:hypothetical protein
LELHLLNLITGVKVQLPSINTLSQCGSHYNVGGRAV